MLNPSRRGVVRGAGAGTVAGACAALAGLICASPAHAQRRDDDEPFGDLFRGLPDRDAAAAQATAYSARDGASRFTLDRSQPNFVLLQFDDDPEVWALRSNWGPRGDEFLRNDVGEVMVRITALGGVTLYGPMGVEGAPAARIGRARPLPGPRPNPVGLQSTVERSLRWFERFAQPNVRIEAAAGLPSTLVGDALSRAAHGMSRAPRGFFGLQRRRVRRIRVERAVQPGARWRDGVLILGVTPGLGHAGRPSSAAVRAALVAGG